MKPTPKPSIKRKVMLAIMLASAAVLLVTVVAFMVYDLLTFRQTMVQNFETQARIIAENSTGSLAFKNENDAANVLASLRTEPHIAAAAIYDADGKLFVKYPAQISGLPDKPQNPGYQFGETDLVFFEPITKSGATLGTLYLRSDLLALTQRIHLYCAISLLITLGSMLVALWLSNTLQRSISNPVIALVQTALKISEQQDYSLRAAKSSEDELGDLSEAFNSMLNQIQAGHSALTKSEEQLRVVADLASVYLCQFDREHRYTFANRAYAERYGFTSAQIIGRHLSEVIGNAAYESARPYIERALGGERTEFEANLNYSTLGSRWVHIIFMPERNLQGHVVAIVGVINDISLRKRQEQELERARDEALNASRAKDNFLAALSHELRTPLNPVLLVASDAASDEQLPPHIRADFEMIRRNVELEARLIDDLLDLTRITRDKLPLDRRPLDIHEILQQAIATVRDDAEKKSIALATDFEKNSRAVSGDAVRLQQVFWNVLKNAVKFTPPGGSINVVTLAPADENKIIIRISDTGIGLTSTEINHVFDIFSQGEHAEPNGSHRFGGLGLGLAISRKLVELHSGTIFAESAGRDAGATFTIELPLGGKISSDANSKPAEIPAPDANLIPQNKSFSILLVEDHEPTRTALAQLLARRNHKVATAPAIAEARALAEKENFDLLISDIGLPDGSGYDLMKELQQRSPIKGIAMSGYGMRQDIKRSTEAGFAAHIIKPVRIQSLEEALNAAMRDEKNENGND